MDSQEILKLVEFYSDKEPDFFKYFKEYRSLSDDIRREAQRYFSEFFYKEVGERSVITRSREIALLFALYLAVAHVLELRRDFKRLSEKVRALNREIERVLGGE